MQVVLIENTVKSVLSSHPWEIPKLSTKSRLLFNNNDNNNNNNNNNNSNNNNYNNNKNNNSNKSDTSKLIDLILCLMWLALLQINLISVTFNHMVISKHGC